MNFVYANVTQTSNFYGNTDPVGLAEKYGSPLYVYNEAILRQRCRDMKNLIDYPNFVVTYSMKANANLALLDVVMDAARMVLSVTYVIIAQEKQQRRRESMG